MLVGAASSAYSSAEAADFAYDQALIGIDSILASDDLGAAAGFADQLAQLEADYQDAMAIIDLQYEQQLVWDSAAYQIDVLNLEAQLFPSFDDGTSQFAYLLDGMSLGVPFQIGLINHWAGIHEQYEAIESGYEGQIRGFEFTFDGKILIEDVAYAGTDIAESTTKATSISTNTNGANGDLLGEEVGTAGVLIDNGLNYDLAVISADATADNGMLAAAASYEGILSSAGLAAATTLLNNREAVSQQAFAVLTGGTATFADSSTTFAQLSASPESEAANTNASTLELAEEDESSDESNSESYPTPANSVESPAEAVYWMGKLYGYQGQLLLEAYLEAGNSVVVEDVYDFWREDYLVDTDWHPETNTYTIQIDPTTDGLTAARRLYESMLGVAMEHNDTLNALFSDLTSHEGQESYEEFRRNRVALARAIANQAATAYYEVFGSVSGLAAEVVIAGNNVVETGDIRGAAIGIAGAGGLKLLGKASSRTVHDVYVNRVRPGARERVFDTPWSKNKGLGSRKFDDFDDLTKTGFEGNTTPWSSMTQEQLSRKLDQVGSDLALLKDKRSGVKRIIWFGTEELPTTGLGLKLKRALDEAGIEYWVVQP